MKLKQYQPLLEAVVSAIIALLLHKCYFMLFKPAGMESHFIYSLYELYLFFSVCSVSILLLLIKVRINNINNVGYTYLLVTCIKMGIAYFFLRPILNSQGTFVATEKTSFFIIFLLFLTIETVITIRILNKN